MTAECLSGRRMCACIDIGNEKMYEIVGGTIEQE